MFLFRTDLNGNVQWIRKINGNNEDYLIRHYSDFSSYIFVSGYYASSTLLIDSTNTDISLKTCPNVGSNDIFIACYSYDGILQWVRNYGSTGDDRGLGVYANADHAIFTGSYSGNISFGSFVLTNSVTDAFMLETDRNGNILGVNRAWGNITDNCENGTIDANNCNLFVGSFNSATLNINNATLTNPNVATSDMFFAKYGRILLSFTVSNNLCYGQTNGSIDLTVSGDGLTPYTYQWSGPGGYVSSNEDITNLSAGWYKVTVTDANNAQKVDSAYVSEGSAILLVFNNTNTSCYGINDGSIDLGVSGGASPYTYYWSTGATSEDINGLSPGTYHVTVTDANFCTTTGSASITSPPTLNIIETISPPSCVPGNDGSIDITVIGGTAPFSYNWSNGSNAEDLYNIDVGVYSVTVTDLNNCTFSKSFNVVNPLAPSISAIVESPSCFPDNDGSIDIIVSGGMMPYSFIWNDGDINEDRYNISNGTYSVTVTDANNCSNVKNNIVVSVSNPPSLSYITKNPSCNPPNNGEIDLIVYNGTMPYSYNWNTGETTQDITGLAPGNYSVTVIDGKNCTATVTISLEIDSPIISITYYGNTTFCQGDSLMLYASNGNGLSFEWYLNGNLLLNSNTYVWAAKQSGLYYVVATNLSGCKGYSDSVAIIVNPKPNISITASSNFICEGTPVLLTANGASSYIWSNGNTLSSISVAPLTSTIYYVTGTNANGCTNTANVNITVNQLPSINGIITHETCANGTGAIDITVTGGQAPYTYSWSNGATSEDISNLNHGTYTVTVTTAFNCSRMYTAIVNPFVPLSSSINTHSLILFCEQISNGEAHVISSNGVNTSYNTQLGVGTTYVTVTDQCNHFVVDSIKVTHMPALQAFIATSNPASCPTSANGSATVLTLNGVPPYTYLWSSGETTSTASQLSVGLNFVTVTDACGAQVVTTNIEHLPVMQASILYTSPVTCSNYNDGGASVSVIDGVMPFTYIWSNGETIATATQLTAGLHSVTVTDACGWQVLSVQIDQPLPLQLHVSAHSPASCSNINDGSASVNGINGTPPYTYQWSSGENITNATQLSHGWNYVTVSDVCTTLVDSIYIDVVPPLSFNTILLSDATCKSSNDGKAMIVQIAGVISNSYQWSNSFSNTEMASDLLPGWNFVTVTNICTSLVDSFYVGYRTPLQPVLSIETTNCYNDSNGTATVIPYYGVPPYSYNWSYGISTDSVITDLPVGLYHVTVSDFCGDTIISFNISNKPPLNASYIKTDIMCYGQNTGNITIFTQNGVAPYSYTWKNYNDTTPYLASLSAGWYYFTVSDMCGSISDSILITQSSPISIVPTITNASFEYTNDGVIEITVLGGTPPFSYTWSNNSTTEDVSNILHGNYIVTITDFFGCTYIGNLTVGYDASEIVIYNAFTPNNDGKNDVWNIKYIEFYPDCEVSVYDQWGVKVFESVGYTSPWDGKYNGKELPSGTYYYVIDLKNDKKVYNGSLTIIK